MHDFGVETQNFTNQFDDQGRSQVQRGQNNFCTRVTRWYPRRGAKYELSTDRTRIVQGQSKSLNRCDLSLAVK